MATTTENTAGATAPENAAQSAAPEGTQTATGQRLLTATAVSITIGRAASKRRASRMTESPSIPVIITSSTINPGFSSATRALANSSRLTRALMYPAPANSNFSNPGTGPIPLTISSAILRGALRSFLASSKASGKAYSPNSTLGGCSITISGRSSA